MIERIIEFSVKKPLVIGVLMLVLLGWGGYSLYTLPIDAVPDVTNIQVDVITVSPSLASSEVERFISTPIEMVMSNIPGLIEMRSTSKFGLSIVKLVFSDETDIYWARQQTLERLQTVDVPQELGRPYLGPVSTGLGEVYQYVIKSKDPYDQSFSSQELRTIQDWYVRKSLLGTPGIADISSFGGYKKEYRVKMQLTQMRSLGVTIDELFNALKNGNRNTGGAYVENYGRAYTIRGVGLVTSLSDIENITIKMNGNIPVLVKDVAVVEIGSAIRYGTMTSNGQGEAVGGVIMMMKGDNSNDVVSKIEDKIAVIEQGLPKGLVIEAFLNRANLVNKAIHTVSQNLIEGALIVVVVILVFLGNWRASLLAASVIPLSMLFAFILMQHFEVVGNIMSLGAIDFGLLVDPSIIVVESVVFYLAVAANAHTSVGPMTYLERQNVVITATKHAKQSVINGGLIILIVYFPILTLTGIEGKYFTPMAKTVSFAIAGAIILAVTYVPMMSALIMKPSKEHGHSFAEKIVDKIHESYEPGLQWAIRNFKITLGLGLAALIGGYIGFSKIGGEFLPRIAEGDLSVEISLPVGSSLTETIELTDKLQERLIADFPDEITKIVSKIGTSEIPTEPQPVERQDMVICLSDKEHWKKATNQEELMSQITDVLNAYPGLMIAMSQPIENRVNDMMSGAKTDVVVKLFGSDLDTLVVKANQIKNALAKVEGANDLQVTRIFGLPQINIEYDRQQMAYYGVSVESINRAVQTAYAGSVAGIIYEGDKRFELVLRLGTQDRKELDNFLNLLITTEDGRSIPMKELAHIHNDNGPAEINHENMNRKIHIGFNVRGRDLQSVVADGMKEVNGSVGLPLNYHMNWGGAFENMNRAKARLAVVLPIALIIIFGLLYMTFGSVKDGLVIYALLPLSAVGGVFALLLRDMNFSISAGVGFIALFGIAVLNGILLVGRFRELDNGKTAITERIVLGVKDRFRPILMTSAVAALGFLPMALSTHVGSEVQRPLATVVIGGLLSSTLLTLFVLPAIYYVVYRNVELKADDFENEK